MLHTGRMRSKALAIGVAVMMVAWLAPGAQATVSYNLDFVFSGQQPTNAGPWGTISFTNGVANTVNVTMTASNLSGTEFISFWGFNSTAAVSGLTVSYSDPDASATFSKCDTSPCNPGSFRADGDGFYEIVGAFQTSAGDGRFTNGEILTFTITGAGLTEANFSPLSTGGAGPGNYNTAIHIQGIAGSTSCSAWAGNSDSTGKAGTGTGDPCTNVSEPSVLLFAGLGLAGIVGVSRRFMVRRDK